MSRAPVDSQRCCASSHEPPDTACRRFELGGNGRCAFCDHAEKCHPGPGATCEIGSGERGAVARSVSQRLVFVQSDRWCKLIDGGTGVYDETLCAYCARPVRADATRLLTARTNDGEWWLVSVDYDLSADEWKDFQTQANGTRAPTLLPIGPDCLRDHPEFAFAVVKYLTLDDLPVMGSGKGHKYTREVSERRAGQRKKEGT